MTRRSPPVRRRRRSGVALMAGGIVCGALAIGGWPASGAAAAPSLFSFDFRAAAHGYQFFNDDSTGARSLEGEVPETRASLATGPVGYGLATLAWPGPLAANAGTLIFVVSPDAPKEAKNLDYPVRAEARSGQNPPTTKYDKVPGASMEASATATKVTSDARVQESTGDPGTFGPTRANSATTLSDGNGIAESSSRVEDIAVADGTIEIESVVSKARAVTNGVTGSGSASTTVTGLKIAGMPASFDQDGLHIGDETQPGNDVMNDIAQQVLSESGIEIVMSAPTREVDGATATTNAGSLVITWTNESGVSGLILGGAQASATAAQGSDDFLGGLLEGGEGDFGGPAGPAAAPPAAPATGSTEAPASSGTGEAGGGSFDLPIDDTTAATSEQPAAPAPDDDSGTAAAGSDDSEFAAEPVSAAGSTNVKTGEVVLGFLAAALFALGLQRLSASVLAEPTGPVCPLGEDA